MHTAHKSNEPDGAVPPGSTEVRDDLNSVAAEKGGGSPVSFFAVGSLVAIRAGK